MGLLLGGFLGDVDDMWVGLVSLLPFDYSQSLSSEPPEKLEMDPTAFLAWFEAQLVELCSVDLARVHDELKLLNGKIKELKLVSVAFRASANSTLLPGPLITKIKKICDQIESPATMFGIDDQSSLKKENLPDTDFLKDFIMKLRSKLKTVDDVTETVKTLKIENSKINILSVRKIKDITTCMLQTLDRLEGIMLKNINLTDFLLKMKNVIIKPIVSLNRKYSKVLSIQSNSINNSIEYKQLKEAEEIYMNTRSNILLVTTARCTEEAGMIEISVKELLRPLRQVAALLGTKKGHADLGSSSPSVANGTSNVFRFLIPLLNCPDNEFLARCVTKSTLDEFASCVLELQLHLRNCSGSATSSSSGSGSVSGSKNCKNGSTSQSKLNSNLQKSSFREETLDFDLEIFTAYVADWQERVQIIAKTTSSSEFDKQYKKHSSARSNVQKAKDTYEKSLVQHTEAQGKFNEMTEEFLDLKRTISTICRHELNADVELVLS